MNNRNPIFRKRENQQYKYIDGLDEDDELNFIKNCNISQDIKHENAESIKLSNSEIEDPTYRKPATLERAIIRYLLYFVGRTPPLPANNKDQIEHWEIVQKNVSAPSRKTILLEDGSVSCQHDMMKRYGQTAEQIEKKKIDKQNKQSETLKDCFSRHGVEGAGIKAFIDYLNKILPKTMKKYEFMTVYDGNYADLAIRHIDWPKDRYIMLQFKAGQAEAGKQTGFNLKKYDDDIYIICLGISNYEPKKIRESADDVDDCELVSIYFIGTTDKKSFAPILYTNNSKHDFEYIYPKYDDEKDQKCKLKNFLNELEDSYPFVTRHKIMFENIIHRESIKEKSGIKCIEDLLEPLGFTFEAPMCQNETTDAIINHPDFDGQRYNVSFKTAFKNKDGKTIYRFDLGAHLQSHLVDIVFVIFNNENDDIEDEFDRLGLINGQRVYSSNGVRFHWSENHKINKDIYHESTFSLTKTKKIKNKIFEILGYK
jgi:hypothetical protein